MVAFQSAVLIELILIYLNTYIIYIYSYLIHRSDKLINTYLMC